MSVNTDPKRFARHLILPQIGAVGQAKLARARVLIVGAGGLGSPVSYYLAAAGVGTLGIVDPDTVEVSNLQRQILFSEADIGGQKATLAAQRLTQLNSALKVEPQCIRVDAANAEELVSHYDIAVDASDNFETRYTLNDACVRLGRPMVHGAISGFSGQVSVFWSPRGPCYRCVFLDAPEDGAAPGVVGATPGVIGSLQASEVIKYVVETGSLLVGRLLLYNGLEMTFREVSVKRSSACEACASLLP